MTYSNWHNGQPMDVNDLLYSLYFTYEWGSEQLENDKTFDTEYTPRVSQTVQTLIGVKPIDDNTVEVYVDFWHFDEAEIADWASIWSATPWELMAAMEQAVIDGKVSFSRSGAVSKDVNWLSLIVPNDAAIIRGYLEEFKQTSFIPPALKQFDVRTRDTNSRYDSTINWINENNHAIISNGPFYLERYSPESRTIAIKSFDDSSYPFQVGHWNDFEKIKFPKITKIEIPDTVNKGSELSVPITTEDASKIHYFLTNSEGVTIASGIESVNGKISKLTFSGEQTMKLSDGANDLKIFAISDAVLRPDIYSQGFFALAETSELPKVSTMDSIETQEKSDYFGIIAIVIGIIIVSTIMYFRRKRKLSQSIQS